MMKMNQDILARFPKANQELQKELMKEMTMDDDFYDEYFAA